METVDKIHEQKWKERKEYDTWHYNYMEQLKEKILKEMNKGTEHIAIDNKILEELFKQEDEDAN